jgi:hypothetical protein
MKRGVYVSSLFHRVSEGRWKPGGGVTPIVLTFMLRVGADIPMLRVRVRLRGVGVEGRGDISGVVSGVVPIPEANGVEATLLHEFLHSPRNNTLDTR